AGARRVEVAAAVDVLRNCRREGWFFLVMFCEPPGVRGRVSYLLCLVTFERMPFKLACSSTAQTIRKPTNSALVSHQMLCGRCGSSLIHSLFEPRRAALRHSAAGSFQAPPRATCEKRFSVGSRTGWSVSLSMGKVA